MKQKTNRKERSGAYVSGHSKNVLIDLILLFSNALDKSETKFCLDTILS